jgi:hypothetical protein
MKVSRYRGYNGGLVKDHLANTSDRLVITITDPFGNQTTFQKSEFVDETTGETGIGAGGGRVAAANPTNDPETAAMELNVPEGAFPEGTAVKLKISKATREEAMPQEPDLPGFHFGSAIRIESEGWDAPLPEGREIDITFPRPDFSVLPESERPTKPEDVHYWVIRKMVKDDGTVMYETLDNWGRYP